MKAEARRLNGGGPCMVAVHIWRQSIYGGEKHPRMEKLFQLEKNDTGGENVTSGQNVAAWTTCHIVESVSHMDELTHSSNPHYCGNRIIACAPHPKSYSQQCSVRFFG